MKISTLVNAASTFMSAAAVAGFVYLGVTNDAQAAHEQKNIPTVSTMDVEANTGEGCWKAGEALKKKTQVACVLIHNTDDMSAASLDKALDKLEKESKKAGPRPEPQF